MLRKIRAHKMLASLLAVLSAVALVMVALLALLAQAIAKNITGEILPDWVKNSPFGVLPILLLLAIIIIGIIIESLRRRIDPKPQPPTHYQQRSKFPFDSFNVKDLLEPAVIRRLQNFTITDASIRYVQRLPTEQYQNMIDGWKEVLYRRQHPRLLIKGNTGLGKTREAIELLRKMEQELPADQALTILMPNPRLAHVRRLAYPHSGGGYSLMCSQRKCFPVKIKVSTKPGCFVRIRRYSSINRSESGCPLSISIAWTSDMGTGTSSSSLVVGLYQRIVRTRPPLIVSLHGLTLDVCLSKEKHEVSSVSSISENAGCRKPSFREINFSAAGE